MRLLLAALLILPVAAFGQAPVLGPRPNDTAATAADKATHYWTPLMMQSAKPKDARSATPAPSAATEHTKAATLPDAVTLDGSAPTEALPEPQQHGSMPSRAAIEEDYAAYEAPAATSQYGLPFTTSQVLSADAFRYPFITAGKLFFTDPGIGNFVCSASVLRIGTVITGGHCLYQPKTASVAGHFFINYMFVPGLTGTTEPAGRWFPIQAGVTGEWAGGGDTFPNSQDVGMMSMASQNGTRIGSVTGFLGLKTQSLAGNHITMLGYPCNLDTCRMMERTDAGASVNGGTNSIIYGSASAGGASGGPWIQDFGYNPVNSGGRAWPLGLNYIVGVTSYQPSDGLGGYLGSSVLNQSTLNLLTALCANPGTC